MSKRAKVFAYVFLWVFLGVMIALAIPTFTHSADHLVSGCLSVLFTGGMLISVGIFKIPKVNAQGEHISLWKQPVIMSGIGCICLAIFLFIELNPNWTNNQFFDVTRFLMILLSYGLIIYGFIYGLVLMLLQYVHRNNPSNRLKELFIVLGAVVIGLLFGVFVIIFPVVSLVTRADIDFVTCVFWIFILILVVIIIISAKRLNQPREDE